MITKEDYEYLCANATPLRHAFFSNYVHTLPKEMSDNFIRIYRSAGYTDYLNAHCGSCILTMCKRLHQVMENYQPEVKQRKKRKQNG